MSAPTPQEMAFELNAASRPIVVASRPNSADHRASPAPAATMEPASM